MQTVRTPDERFANLAGYDFERGHFLQEDQGQQLANVMLDFIRST